MTALDVQAQSQTRMRFARFRLSGHTEDDPRVRAGRWEPTDCLGSEDAVKAAGGIGLLTVWSSCTDLEGDYGTPMMFTEWGSSDGTTPVSADYRDVDRHGHLGKCYHLRYVVEGGRS